MNSTPSDPTAETMKPNPVHPVPSTSPPPVATVPFRLETDADGQYWFVQDSRRQRVRVHLCFPWTSPNRHLSLRDENENELALVANPQTLDSDSQRTLDAMVTEARFVMEVDAILSVNEEFELRVWIVRTKQGMRTFQTKLEDWPRQMPGGGLLLRDIFSDLYFISDPHSLDDKSRKILWAFMD